MPTLLLFDSFRFFFYSNDHDPPHVQVEKGEEEAKFELIPSVRLVGTSNMKSKDLKKAQEIVQKNQANFLKNWQNYFKK